jgi:hypothetical protein
MPLKLRARRAYITVTDPMASAAFENLDIYMHPLGAIVANQSH